MDVVLLSLGSVFLFSILVGYAFLLVSGRFWESIQFPPTVTELYQVYCVVFVSSWGYILVRGILHPYQPWVVAMIITALACYFSYIPLFVSAQKKKTITTALQLTLTLKSCAYVSMLVGTILDGDTVASASAGVILVNGIFCIYWLGTYEFDGDYLLHP